MSVRATWRMWVEQYQSIKTLQEDLAIDQASPQTLKMYAFAVQRFMRFLGVDDPDTALEETRAEPEKHINRFLRAVVGGEGLSTKYAANLSAGLKKWFRANDVKVETDAVRKPSTRTVTEDKVPDIETLRQLHRNANTRQRFLLTGMVSSGLRAGGIVNLKLRDLDMELDSEAIVVYVPHRAAKGYMNSKTPDRVMFHTFMSGEARRALQDYLDYRQRMKGEDIGPDSPLITGEYGNTIGHGISYKSANRIWLDLLRTTGLTEKSRSWHVYHAHTLRKFFRTNCAYARIPEEFVHKWMGHVGYLEREYLKLSAERDLELYRQAEPHLTISKVAQLERDLDTRVEKKVFEALVKLGINPSVVKRLREESETYDANGDSNNPGMFG